MSRIPTPQVLELDPQTAWRRALDVLLAGAPGDAADVLREVRDAVGCYMRQGPIEGITPVERQLANHLQILAAGQLLTARAATLVHEGTRSNGKRLISAHDAFGFTRHAPSLHTAVAASAFPEQPPVDPPGAASIPGHGPQTAQQASAFPPASSPTPQAQAAHASPSEPPGRAMPASMHGSDLRCESGGFVDHPSDTPL